MTALVVRGPERRAMRAIDAQLGPDDIPGHVVAFGRMDRALIGEVEVLFRCAHGYGVTHVSYADWTEWVFRAPRETPHQKRKRRERVREIVLDGIARHHKRNGIARHEHDRTEFTKVVAV